MRIGVCLPDGVGSQIGFAPSRSIENTIVIRIIASAVMAALSLALLEKGQSRGKREKCISHLRATCVSIVCFFPANVH